VPHGLKPGWGTSSRFITTRSSPTGRVKLSAGLDYTLDLLVKGLGDGAPPFRVFIRPPSAANVTTLRSRSGAFVDYYFLAGGGIDGSIALYRDATGWAPLYRKSALGFWQSKEHYHNRSELTTAAHGFRQRGIPIDNIVQDWAYW
jgi:hypothetical protein